MEQDNKYRPLCIFHGNCADGFTAAWVIKKRWPEAELFAGKFGEPPPDVHGRNVIIVDFSYDRKTIIEMCRVANTLVLLDHHESAQRNLEGVQDEIDRTTCRIFLDMDHSGARLAWDYAYPLQIPPKLVLHVEDRDLWKFDMFGTREISSYVFSYPYEIGDWTELSELLETGDGWQRGYEQGGAILRQHDKDIEELLKLCTRPMTIGGYEILVANMPYTMASDAAGELAKTATFGATYYDQKDRRNFSLRSVGNFNVSLVAQKYGGGGHKNAAGFSVPLGWYGDK